MIYLFLGEDTHVKEQKQTDIKNKFLTSPDSFNFDYEVLHAPKLDAATLKKALLNLPAIAAKRVVVIRSAQKLDSHNKDLILEFVESKVEQIVLIIDFDENLPNNAFVTKLSGHAQTFRCSKAEERSVFDVTNAIERRNLTEALKVLADLFTAGQHPLQIMGAIVWFWGKQRPRLSATQFNEGLLALQEADLNIKRSRFNPEYSVEVLVTKLFSLTAL